MFLFQQLKGPRDESGDPRLCYVIYRLDRDKAIPLDVRPGEYWRDPDLRGAARLRTVYINTAEFKDWMRMGAHFRHNNS